MFNQKCPCENCLVKICCRLKPFRKLRYCDALSEFLGFLPRDNIKKHFKNFPRFHDTLKPIHWTYSRWPEDHKRKDKDYKIIQLPELKVNHERPNRRSYLTLIFQVS